MTSGQESSTARNGIIAFLPWLLGIAALALYLATLNHWVSFLNLTYVSQAGGLNWEPEFRQPAWFLVTYPFRWLPARSIPVALNLFSTVCGVLALVQLARSVMILPHDRTQDQRDRETHPFGQLTIPLAWAPPVLAVVACGLQLTFWEYSTNGTPEMFDLLLFGYVIRSLLEYRLDERDSRLYRAAFVQGVGMANNFAMIGFFPLFIAALIWIRGFAFFRVRFLSRMLLWGLVGLSLYLLFPILNGFSKDGSLGAWETLRGNFSFQRRVLAQIVFSKGRLIHGLRMDDSDPLWVLGVTSLLPLLMLAIRWPSHFGDTSRMGTLLAKWVFHVAHVFLFVLCVWVCFDSPISPRHIMSKYDSQNFLPLLTFYYLGALAIGYFTGYFLLVFRPMPVRGRRNSSLVVGVHRLATALTLGLLVVVAAGLFYRNLPAIRLTNGPLVKGFASAIVEGLPPRGVIVSDDRRILQLTELLLKESGRRNNYLPLDTDAWRALDYHAYMRRNYAGRWPEEDVNEIETFDETHLVNSFVKLARNSEVVYLHPSFGLFFEHVVNEPHFAVEWLKPYPTNSMVISGISKEVISENEAFWTHLEGEQLRSIVAAGAAKAKNSGPIEKIFAKARVPREKNVQARALGVIYSRLLNFWAVELQKANEWDRAASRLELALNLNPDNVVAKANLAFNTLYRGGDIGDLDLSRPLDDRFGNYRSWDQAVRDNGPYDEPNVLYGQAYYFLRYQNFRQAAQYFDRVRKLYPNEVTSRIWLANLNLLHNLPDQALAVINEIRSSPAYPYAAVTNAVDLMSIEAGAYFAKNESAQAMDLIASQLERHKTNSQLIVAAIKLYSDNGRLTNAYALLEKKLKAKPDDPLLLMNKGVLLMGETNFVEAIQLFGQVLSAHTNMPTARLYRAIAYLKMRDLDKAKQDYELIVQDYPNLREALFGLHDIAFEQKDTVAALDYGKRYLSNAIPVAPETKMVWTRVKSLDDEVSGKGSTKDKKARSGPN